MRQRNRIPTVVDEHSLHFRLVEELGGAGDDVGPGREAGGPDFPFDRDQRPFFNQALTRSSAGT